MSNKIKNIDLDVVSAGLRSIFDAFGGNDFLLNKDEEEENSFTLYGCLHPTFIITLEDDKIYLSVGTHYYQSHGSGPSELMEDYSTIADNVLTEKELISMMAKITVDFLLDQFYEQYQGNSIIEE